MYTSFHNLYLFSRLLVYINLYFPLFFICSICSLVKKYFSFSSFGISNLFTASLKISQKWIRLFLNTFISFSSSLSIIIIFGFSALCYDLSFSLLLSSIICFRSFLLSSIIFFISFCSSSENKFFTFSNNISISSKIV